VKRSSFLLLVLVALGSCQGEPPNTHVPSMANHRFTPETLDIGVGETVRWFNDVGYQADIKAVRQIYPGMKTCEEFLRANGWENAQPEAAGAQWGS